MAGTTIHNDIVLQDRDNALLRTLTEDFRVLSREQIGELFPMGSVARLNFRLKQLRDAGYLSSRPLAGPFRRRSSDALQLPPLATRIFSFDKRRRLYDNRREILWNPRRTLFWNGQRAYVGEFSACSWPSAS